jgi:hypothetical protein
VAQLVNRLVGRAPSLPTSALCSMSDSDPPRYTPERPVAWILLFFHHMARIDIVPQNLSASTVKAKPMLVVGSPHALLPIST